MRVCDVTVIIPNYNRTTLLRRALHSVQTQTARPREVIVVDDCSHKAKLAEIRQIVREFRSVMNIILLVNDRNRGANHSRNRGISAAGSAYVAFLDSDDLWMPEKLRTQMALIEKAKTTDSRPILSGTGRYRVNAAGEIIARQFGGNLLNAEKIRHSNFIGTLSSIVVETWIARHIHGFNEVLRACQDWDFFIRLADYVQYVGVAEPLCVYVDHDQDRITLNSRDRLKAHLFIYKNYIKERRHILQCSGSEFYRNIAEAYQTAGNERKANIYYAKYKSQRVAKIGFQLIPEAFWFCLYSSRGAPPIKAQRYSRYKKMMNVLKKEPQLRLQIEHDHSIIRQMMSQGVL